MWYNLFNSCIKERMILLKEQKYFVLNIAHKESTANQNKIYEDLSTVRHLNIPFIPLKSKVSSFAPVFSSVRNNNTAIQIALPPTIDHMKIFDMVKTVNDKLDVTLVGEQTSVNLSFAAEPESYGLSHFTLGEKYPGISD